MSFFCKRSPGVRAERAKGEFFGEICIKHLTKPLDFATISVACGYGRVFLCSFFAEDFLRNVLSNCGKPRSFTQSKLPRLFLVLLALLGTFPQKPRRRFPSQMRCRTAASLGRLRKVNSLGFSSFSSPCSELFRKSQGEDLLRNVLSNCGKPRYFAQSARAPHRRKLSASRASFSRRTFTQSKLPSGKPHPGARPQDKLWFSSPYLYGLRIFRNLTRR